MDRLGIMIVVFAAVIWPEKVLADNLGKQISSYQSMEESRPAILHPLSIKVYIKLASFLMFWVKNQN